MKANFKKIVAVVVATVIIIASMPNTLMAAGQSNIRAIGVGQQIFNLRAQLIEPNGEQPPVPQPEIQQPPVPQPPIQQPPVPQPEIPQPPVPQPELPQPPIQQPVQQLTMTFSLAGGNIGGNTSNHVVTIPSGTAPSAPSPTRSGFTFAGWAPSIPASATSSMSFTAVWTPVATPQPPVPQPEVQQPIVTPLQPDFTQTQPIVTDPNIDTTPQQQASHEVTFLSHQGGNVVTTINVQHGSLISVAQVPQAPMRDGFTFAGWSPMPTAQPITGPLTIVGQWTEVNVPQNHEVRFLSHQGGDVYTTLSIQHGSLIGATQVPQAPTRNGFTFTGWSPNPLAQPITGPLTIVGQWEQVNVPQSHTVTFTLQGATFLNGSATMSLQVPHNTAIPWLNVIQNMPSGTDRSIWMRNGQNFNQNTLITEPMQLTARAEIFIENFTVTFVLNGGTFNNSANNVTRSVPAGSSLLSAGALITPVLSGHTLDSSFPWLLDGRNFDTNSPINQNITLVANWRTNSTAGAHLVTFELNGGSINGNFNNITVWVNHGSVISHTDFPNHRNTIVRSGFILNNTSPWVTVGGTVFNHNITITGSTTLRANWVTTNQVTITFNPNGGQRSGSGTGNFTRSLPSGTNWNATFPNESLASFANVTRSGFTFQGWTMQNGTQFTQGTTVPNNNFTVTASWAPTSANSVNVVFNPLGGNLRGTTNNTTLQISRHNSFVQSTGFSSFQNANLVPTRSGFTFGGWELPNGNLVNINTTIFTENITLIARWNGANVQTISFNPNGGMWADNSVINQNRQVARGQSIRSHHNSTVHNLIPPISRQGYSFVNWYIGNSNNVFTENTVINSDMTVNARWVAINVPAHVPPPTTAQPPILPPVTGASLVNQVISLGQQGSIFSGGAPVNLSSDLGVFHINTAGVSVLPARAILSILFGADPYDPYLFLWDGATSTFTIDPQGYNIRIQVGQEVMYVRNVPRQILTGTGADAFPVAAYVDPTDGRLYVPVRAIAESIGFTVGWDAGTGTVLLTPPQR